MKIQIKSEMDLINYILLVPEILLVHKRSSQITNFSSGYFSDCLCPGKKKSPENSLASNRNTQWEQHTSLVLHNHDFAASW